METAHLTLLMTLFNIHIIYIQYVCFSDLDGMHTDPVDSCLISTANSGPPDSCVITNYTFYN